MIDLSNDRKSVETQILGFIRKEQVVPFRVLQHYVHIIQAENQESSSASLSEEIDNSLLVFNIRDSVNDLQNKLSDLNEYITTNNNKVITDGVVSVSTTPQTLIYSNNSVQELTIQNKSSQNFIYVRHSSEASLSSSIAIPPLGTASYFKDMARMPISMLTAQGTADVYFYKIELDLG